MRKLITPPLTAKQLAKEIDIPEIDVAAAIADLMPKGYLIPRSYSRAGVTWEVNLPSKGVR